MAIDLFNNPSNDYIYPGLSPCPGVGDDQYLVWTENGLAIIKGSDVVSEIGFNDLQVPVNSFSKQQVILGPGEVTFIPGLTKGLCNKNMGFFLPVLNSSDLELNSFFLGIDFSINYYKNFSYTSTHIDVSGNFEQNIGISDALNIKLSELGIKVASTYDASILYFTGTTPGYEYFITNAILRVYDASEAFDSPFPVGGNAPTYDLLEDPSSFIPAMKYPNTAMQGIALKGIYPSEQAECDKWLYLHHVTDYVITFDPYDVNYDTEVSTNLAISYPVKYPGKPDFMDYVTMYDIYGMIIDSSIIGDASISNCIITTSDVSESNVRDSSIETCTLTEIYASNTVFEQSTIDTADIENSIINNGSTIINSRIIDSWINVYKLLVNPSTGQIIWVTDDASFVDVVVNGGEIWDSSINQATLYDVSLYNCWIEDSSVTNCTFHNCSFDNQTLVEDTVDVMMDPSIACEFDVVQDTSVFYLRHRRKIEIGMNGCSVEDLMSAGDYLNLVTNRGWWKKVGDIYIWISSPDCEGDCLNKNLIEGFYAFNPHEFTIQIEYMVIV